MKSWQIFAFSLIPLALVFTGVIIGSMDGKDSKLETFPTPPPSPGSVAPVPDMPAGSISLVFKA